MSMNLNKNKNIGRVLFIVEGSSTEKYILWKIFADIFDYQVETKMREHPYNIFNKKDNPYSKVFVINAKESNIKNIKKDDEFLNNLFRTLVEEYDFDVDDAAIYYLFDRDPESNTDLDFILKLLNQLTNSRENEDNYRQGLLLLSYPSIESFTLSCFESDSFNVKFGIGNELKKYLEDHKFNQSKITEDKLLLAATTLCNTLIQINNGEKFDIDDFKKCNIKVFNFEESLYSTDSVFCCLCLLCISLIDLGLIIIDDE